MLITMMIVMVLLIVDIVDQCWWWQKWWQRWFWSSFPTPVICVKSSERILTELLSVAPRKYLSMKVMRDKKNCWLEHTFNTKMLEAAVANEGLWPNQALPGCTLRWTCPGWVGRLGNPSWNQCTTPEQANKWKCTYEMGCLVL